MNGVRPAISQDNLDFTVVVVVTVVFVVIDVSVTVLAVTVVAVTVAPIVVSSVAVKRVVVVTFEVVVTSVAVVSVFWKASSQHRAWPIVSSAPAGTHRLDFSNTPGLSQTHLEDTKQITN